ncbi:hypothetical protein PoB_000311800 [Plakobranchus ocellatus]|uniref:Uncharacterized protein n=1 Tax=Plakobranchus ocellatus TaxID=259542 RepID=A0AAV3Y2X9_9GAST|nr:hypothetical protein PoB_000311800 [Plakobranchus ocellatus]
MEENKHSGRRETGKRKGEDLDSDSDSDDNQQPVRFPAAKQRRVHSDDLPAWSEVAEGETSANSFRFMPPNGVGLLVDLTAKSSPLHAFQVLFTQQVVHFLLAAINTYADHRCALNRPP